MMGKEGVIIAVSGASSNLPLVLSSLRESCSILYSRSHKLLAAGQIDPKTRIAWPTQC